MSTGSNSDSDIDMKTRPLKKEKKQKIPISPTADILKEPRKLTTREMINDALGELKTRKGVSYQAIKKYLVEKYEVDTDKMSFYIKKYLKNAVESGTIIQTKGIGASGSFRLAAVKKKTEKKLEPEKKLKKMEKSKKTDKVEKVKDKEKKSKVKEDKKKIEKKTVIKDNKDQTKSKKVKINKEAKEKPKKQEKKTAVKSNKDSKTTKSKGTKMATQTPAKKKTTMMKRKSIGSIIKPPKMKPKAS